PDHDRAVRQVLCALREVGTTDQVGELVESRVLDDLPAGAAGSVRVAVHVTVLAGMTVLAVQKPLGDRGAESRTGATGGFRSGQHAAAPYGDRRVPAV